MYENIRIFTAIPLPDSVRGSLTGSLPGWRNELRFLRWAHPSDWHLTLHFIGDAPAASVPAVEKAMNEAASKLGSAFNLTLNGMGTFGRPESPSVLWLGLAGIPKELLRLHALLGETLAAEIGFVPEKRPYGPHVTLARKYAGNRPFPLQERLAEASAALAANPVEWTADRFVIFRTHMGQSPMYEELAGCRLGSSPPLSR